MSLHTGRAEDAVGHLSRRSAWSRLRHERDMTGWKEVLLDKSLEHGWLRTWVPRDSTRSPIHPPGARPGESHNQSKWDLSDRFADCHPERMESLSPVRLQSMTNSVVIRDNFTFHHIASYWYQGDSLISSRSSIRPVPGTRPLVTLLIARCRFPRHEKTVGSPPPFSSPFSRTKGTSSWSSPFFLRLDPPTHPRTIGYSQDFNYILQLTHLH